MQGLVRVLGEAPGYAAEWDIGERLAGLQTDPAIRQKYLQDRSAATAEAFAMMGPEAEAARARAAREREIAAGAQYGLGTDVETGGLSGWAGRGLRASHRQYEVESGIGAGMWGGAPGAPTVEPWRGAVERLADGLDRNQQTLERIANYTEASKKPERVVMRGEVE